MNVKRVLSFASDICAPMKPTPAGLAQGMVAAYFNGRGGNSALVSREELKDLLEGAAELALKHCQTAAPQLVRKGRR